MEAENIFSKLSHEAKPKLYHFEIFKGTSSEDGKIQRVRSVGRATHVDGQKTFKVKVSTLEEIEFFLLPEKKFEGRDFTLLRRWPSDNLSRKYVWKTVGEGKILSGLNSGLMQLTWDLFNAKDIYMNLHPKFEVECESVTLNGEAI